MEMTDKARAKQLLEEGKLKHILGQRAAALQCYSQALALDISLSEAHLLLGVAFEEDGNIQNALLHWRQAHEIQPDFQELLLRLAALLKKEGLFEEAIGLYEKLVVLDASDAELHFDLATVLAGRYHQLCEQVGLGGAGLEESLELGQRAIQSYKRSIELNPEWYHKWEQLWSVQFLMGQIEESLGTIREYMQFQRAQAKAKGLDRTGVRFLASNCVGNIGVISMLETHVKAKLLGLQPDCKTFQLIDPGSYISNRTFLDYWKKYITYVEDPGLFKSLSPIASYLMDFVNWAVTIDQQEYFYTAASAKVRKRWEDEGRPPLLTLTEHHHQDGWDNLQKLGIPRDAWFVCLHVREAGFKNDLAVDEHRNAKIESYCSAIEAITAAGGWVVRVGDPSMTALPKMPNVIDYVHNEIHSEWMDVFLAASCRFFISTCSGLCGIAYAFGVPVVQTNFAPMSALSGNCRDIFIPKLIRSKSDGRLLEFQQVFSHPIATSYLMHRFHALGVEVVDNTAEEIRDVVLEMLARLSGEITYSDDDEKLQQRFKNLTDECGTCMGVGIESRIGRDFLNKYSHLL